MFEFCFSFFVPRRNREGRSVLSRRELALLGSGFEIGGHSFDHVRLTSVPPDEVARQVRAIEDLWLAPARDPFQLPTTLQLYRHPRSTYLKNLARGRHFLTRAPGARVVLRGHALGDVLRVLLV